MPLLLETQAALGHQFAHCTSRSLILERFADPTLREDPRRDFFQRAIGKPALPHKRDAWRDFLLTGLGLKPEDLLFGKLQARLMINMAGGVMENAGLCLDRLTGIPYVPGSAVKGCARRFAIQSLMETVADQKAAVLTNIALVFGWVDQDWRNASDFAYGCGSEWNTACEEAQARLWQKLSRGEYNPSRWMKELGSYAGVAQFLPAYPLGTPPSPDVELDVVTCHHPEYYKNNAAYRSAPDTENPIPVVFPAAAPDHIFIFAVLGDDQVSRDKAQAWLRGGLVTFGLGAKTGAGYGWFEVETTTTRYRQEIQTEIDKLVVAQKRLLLQADPKILDELKTRKEDQLRGMINQYQFEEKFWPKEKDEVFQLSLLTFCTETNPSLYQKEKANPKSKIVKALHNLASKFGRLLA